MKTPAGEKPVSAKSAVFVSNGFSVRLKGGRHPVWLGHEGKYTTLFRERAGTWDTSIAAASALRAYRARIASGAK